MKEMLLTLILSIITAFQWVSNVAVPLLSLPYNGPQTSVISHTATTTTDERTEEQKDIRNGIVREAPKKTAHEKIEPEKGPAGSESDSGKAEPKITPATTTSQAPTPAAPIPKTSTQTSVSTDITIRIEAEILTLMNAEREKVGLAPLSHDAHLATIARTHSADMLANDYFSHEDRSGCTSSCRANTAGYVWMSIGENIYMTSGYNLTADEAATMIVNGWMNSPGHRTNILRPTFTHSGIGVYARGRDIYTTAMYAKPK